MYAILIVLLSFATVASAEMRVTTDDAIKAATKKNEPDCHLAERDRTHHAASRVKRAAERDGEFVDVRAIGSDGYGDAAVGGDGG